MADTLGTLIHRLWLRAKGTNENPTPYDQTMWEDLDQQVSELQQKLKEETKRANYWQTEAQAGDAPSI